MKAAGFTFISAVQSGSEKDASIGSAKQQYPDQAVTDTYLPAIASYPFITTNDQIAATISQIAATSDQILTISAQITAISSPFFINCAQIAATCYQNAANSVQIVTNSAQIPAIRAQIAANSTQIFIICTQIVKNSAQVVTICYQIAVFSAQIEATIGHPATNSPLLVIIRKWIAGSGYQVVPYCPASASEGCKNVNQNYRYHRSWQMTWFLPIRAPCRAVNLRTPADNLRPRRV